MPTFNAPRRTWIVNEARQQAANLATHFKRASAEPWIQASEGDVLLGRYAKTGTQWEAWLHDYMRPYADKGAVALDIGANVGFHTNTLASLFGQVHAFEPCSDTARLLRANTAGSLNVSVHQVALGSEVGVVRMSVKTENRGASHISADGDEVVEIRRLDDFSFDSRVALIKIDVEGHERDAFMGGERTLREHRPVILFEDTEFAGDLLTSMGYLVRRIAISDFIAVPV